MTADRTRSGSSIHRSRAGLSSSSNSISTCRPRTGWNRRNTGIGHNSDGGPAAGLISGQSPVSIACGDTTSTNVACSAVQPATSADVGCPAHGPKK